VNPVTAPPPAGEAATVPVTGTVPVTAAARAPHRTRPTAAPEGHGGTGR